MRRSFSIVATIVMAAFCCGFALVTGAADLDQLAKSRSAWPKEVTLKQKVVFPVIVGGKTVEEIELKAGETVALVEVLGAQIKIQHNNATKIIPAKFTDLTERIVQTETPAKPELPVKPGALEQAREFAVAHDTSAAIQWASEKAKASTVIIPMGKGKKHGIIIAADGYILTSHGAIAGKSAVSLKFRGATFNGKVVWAYPTGDLALIKISADKLPFVELGNSDALGVGDIVISIGAPRGFSNWTATGFIVSTNAPGGPATRLQTTMIADGNFQGSPVVNLKGELVGIVTNIPRVGATYAVPSNYIKQLLPHFKGGADSQK